MALPTKPYRRLLGAFSVLPDVRVPGLDPGEKVVLVVRSHPVTQVVWILNTLFLVGIIVLAERLLLVFLGITTPFLVNLLLFALVLYYTYFNILSWIFNVGVVTTRRVIDLDVQGLINTVSTSTRLEEVQEINIKSGGVLAGLFHYGSLFILTASVEKNIEFTSVPLPHDVADIIDECKHELLKKNPSP